MRVFFATPDPNQHGAVSDALLARGEPWQVLAYARPDETRQVLAEAAADVFVVDLALGDADSLLRHVLYTSPQTARVVLAYRGQEDAAIRLLGLCHGVLVATDPIESIADALVGYAALAHSLDRPSLRTQVGALTRLPGAPTLYLAICRALANPNVDTADITRRIMGDPVVAARVLQIVNSALYSPERPVESIAFAVSRLGLSTIRNLVLAAELYTFSGADAVRAEGVRQRSLLASWLAPRLQHGAVIDPEVAGTAALLAGLGDMLPELDGQSGAAFPLMPALQDEAAAYLMGLWQLPSILQQAVAWQRAPRLSGATFGLVGVVHIATALAFERSIDEAWLETCGVKDALPGWRALARSMGRSVA